jgi:hypothetical protein
MILDDALVPTTSARSRTVTSNGAAIASQPTSRLEAFGSENTTDMVVPASVVTMRSTGPLAPVTVTVCLAAARSPTVMGETPRASPSMTTRAPGGSVITESFVAATGNSRYSVTSAPAVTSRGTLLSSDPRRIVMM